MKLLALLALVCALPLPALTLDREAFSIARYDLTANVEPEQQRLAVRGKISLRNDSGTVQTDVALQISYSLHWLSIRADGKLVEFSSQQYTSDIDHSGALTEAIFSISPLGPGKTLELEIGYEGTVPQDATRLTRIGAPADVAKHSDWDQIGRNFAAVRGIGYVAWYPVVTQAASLSDGDAVPQTVGRWKQRELKAEMNVNLCLLQSMGDGSAALQAFMNDGRAVTSVGDSAGASSGGATCSSHQFRDLNNTVPVFVFGHYLNNEHSGASIHYFPDHKSGADDYALALDQAAPAVAEWFGPVDPKSFAKPELLDLPDAQDQPFEAGNVLFMPLTASDTELLLAAVRQLATSSIHSRRLWVSQGLAGYAQAAYMENEKSRAAALAYLGEHRPALVASEKDNMAQGDTKAAARSLINDADEFYVESKAVNVWWMLRDMVGESALTAALRAYKASDDKDAYYVEKLLEAQSHRDLGWFFNDWVYRDRGLPEFRIVSVYPRQLERGGYMVTVTVENRGSAAAEVPITLRMTEGVEADRLVVPAKSQASVRIRAPMLPQEAVVNDGSVPEADVGDNRFKIPVPE